MNLAQFVKVLSEASSKSKAGKAAGPFGFSKLSPRQQEKIVRSANYKLGRDPRTTDFNISDKYLLNSIKERLNNYNYMNNLKNGKQIEGYSSTLDKKADEFLKANADKISKDLEKYSTIPLDYEDSVNKVDLSKFVDDEDNVLEQTEALDNLLYNENIGSINRITDYDEDVMNAKTFKDLAKIKGLDDLETKGLTLLLSEPYTAVTYLENQPELMRALAYRINHNRELQKANAWKNLNDYKKSPVTIYSKDIKNTSFDPIRQELRQPLDNLSKKARDDINRSTYKTKNQRDIEKALYNLTDEEDRLYNTNNLPGLETEIDPYTGNVKNTQYKFADEPHYSKSDNTIEYFDEDDIINNKIDEGIYDKNDESSEFIDNQKLYDIINTTKRNIEQTQEENRALNAAIYDWYRENISKSKNKRKNYVDLSKYIEDNSF